MTRGRFYRPQLWARCLGAKNFVYRQPHLGVSPSVERRDWLFGDTLFNEYSPQNKPDTLLVGALTLKPYQIALHED